MKEQEPRFIGVEIVNDSLAGGTLDKYGTDQLIEALPELREWMLDLKEYDEESYERVKKIRDAVVNEINNRILKRGD